MRRLFAVAGAQVSPGFYYFRMPQTHARRTTNPISNRTDTTRTAITTPYTRLRRLIAGNARPTLQRRALTGATASANILAEPAHIMAVSRDEPRKFRAHTLRLMS
jgi:hypothetical protein